MPNLIEREFNEFMNAGYGSNWKDRISDTQLVEMRRVFYGGVSSCIFALSKGDKDTGREIFDLCKEFFEKEAQDHKNELLNKAKESPDVGRA